MLSLFSSCYALALQGRFWAHFCLPTQNTHEHKNLWMKWNPYQVVCNSLSLSQNSTLLDFVYGLIKTESWKSFPSVKLSSNVTLCSCKCHLSSLFRIDRRKCSGDSMTEQTDTRETHSTKNPTTIRNCNVAKVNPSSCRRQWGMDRFVVGENSSKSEWTGSELRGFRSTSQTEMTDPKTSRVNHLPQCQDMFSVAWETTSLA